MNRILSVFAVVFLLFTAIGAVQANTNQPPVSDPGGPYYGTVGVPLTFDGSGSYDPDPGGTIIEYYWQFSDSVSGYEKWTPIFTHTFPVAGTFTLLLTVTDNDGAYTHAQTTAYITPQQVIPEVPLGSIVASAAMIFALVGYFAVPRFRKKE